MINKFKSPNFDARDPGTSIDFLIIHYTACDLDESLNILTDENSPHPVSAHYLMDETGQTFCLVDEEKRAWHAGESYWRGTAGLNTWSIGIELVNPGHGANYQTFPKPQMESLLELSQAIVKRHQIPPQNILGHSDIASQRKQDPGELFDWQWLAQHGVGTFPTIAGPEKKNLDVSAIQKALHDFGYLVPSSGVMDEPTIRVIKAFQMHYYPDRLDGQIDQELASRLYSMLP